MPHSLSAKKRVRQNEKRRLHNKAIKSSVRTVVKRYRASIDSGDVDGARSQYPLVVKKLDQAAAKGIYHKNTVSRYKSRLATLLNKQSA